MIELPAWAYYSLHVLLVLWFIVLIIGKDYIGAAVLVVGYILGRLFREVDL